MTNLNWLQPIWIGHFNQLKNWLILHDQLNIGHFDQYIIGWIFNQFKMVNLTNFFWSVNVELPKITNKNWSYPQPIENWSYA
jgi:hypothetical protein